MEMMHIKRYRFLQVVCLCICLVIGSFDSIAQPPLKKYSVRDGMELIELSKHLPEKELDEFIRDFDLADLDLKNFFKTNRPDSLLKKGWLITINNEMFVALARPMNGMDLNDLLMEKIHFNKFPFGEDVANTAVVRYGSNKFKNKHPFLIQDSAVVFYLKGHKKAGRVLLAGSFTN